MIAVFLDGRGGLEVVERPVPEPLPGEALVRVRMAGVCATDLELRKGYMGFRGIPGHEFVGLVERAEPSSALEGARVVGEINAACGACELCAEGLQRHCPRRTVLGILGRDGAFADYLTLPLSNLHRVPDSLPDERLVFAEPLAAACEILDQVEVRGKRLLVLGDGKLGSLAALVVRHAGAEVTVLGRHERKLEPLAREGIRTVLASDEQALSRKGFEVVVEATGRPEGLERAIEFVRPRGVIVLKSTCAARKPLHLAPLVVDEVTLVGSRCGRFPPALELLSSGVLRPEATIDARFGLREAEAALDAASRPGARKVVFEVSR